MYFTNTKALELSAILFFNADLNLETLLTKNRSKKMQTVKLTVRTSALGMLNF